MHMSEYHGERWPVLLTDILRNALRAAYLSISIQDYLEYYPVDPEADHAGGNAKLLKSFADLVIYGGDDRVEAINCKITHNDTFSIGNLSVKCLATSCHMRGHICYYITREGEHPPSIFTGDTLFAGGCGRFFEGTADQMYKALVEVLGSLPEETKVYCGYEYTANNLSLHVEPENVEIQQKLDRMHTQRANNLPTVPSTIKDEKLTNPFESAQTVCYET